MLGGGGSVAFEVFICVHSGRDCICQWILCYLSGLVVLKTSRTDLYLDARLLIMRTDAQD